MEQLDTIQSKYKEWREIFQAASSTEVFALFYHGLYTGTGGKLIGIFNSRAAIDSFLVHADIDTNDFISHYHVEDHPFLLLDKEEITVSYIDLERLLDGSLPDGEIVALWNQLATIDRERSDDTRSGTQVGT